MRRANVADFPTPADPERRSRALALALATAQRAERAVIAALGARREAVRLTREANHQLRHARDLGAVGTPPDLTLPPELAGTDRKP